VPQGRTEDFTGNPPYSIPLYSCRQRCAQPVNRAGEKFGLTLVSFVYERKGFRVVGQGNGSLGFAMVKKLR
jgi:hypothetical protein